MEPEVAAWLRWLRGMWAARCPTGGAGPCRALFRPILGMLVSLEVVVGRFERSLKTACAKAFAMAAGPPRPEGRGEEAGGA